jgi:hypothetical protein
MHDLPMDQIWKQYKSRKGTAIKCPQTNAEVCAAWEEIYTDAEVRDLGDHLTNSALLLDISDVEQIIIKSPRGKAPGPDGIPFEVLRLAPYTYAQHIIEIYDYSIKKGRFSPEILSANVILIPKGNRV